ncbi:MAG TPA: hypothetical protein VGG20_23110 [Thermoanaerobaculia bacterium]|jgi:hypothetical protein
MADLTISNPQPFVVTAAIDLGAGLETRNLAFNETWAVKAPAAVWIAYFLLESGELLAQAELPAGATVAQLLLEEPYGILLRADINAPLKIANGLDIPIRVDVLPVGESDIETRELAPVGHPGSSWSMPLFRHGQWIGFYSEDDEYIGASLDGSSEIETITLTEAGAAYVIGDPFQVEGAGAVTTTGFVREPKQ